MLQAARSIVDFSQSKSVFCDQGRCDGRTREGVVAQARQEGVFIRLSRVNRRSWSRLRREGIALGIRVLNACANFAEAA